jgi:hypothetical protein
LVETEPPFLITDPYFEGGQKFVIRDADARVVFALLKGRFEKGAERDLYRIVLDVEPYLRARIITEYYSITFVEASAKQIGDDVSVQLVEYCGKKIRAYSELYFVFAKYLFSQLGRDVPSEVLEQLHFRDFVASEERSVFGFLLFFLVCVGIVVVGLLNAGASVGVLFLVVPVVVVVYYLYGLRKKGLSVEKLG